MPAGPTLEALIRDNSVVDDVSEWETVDGDHEADHEEDLHTALPNLQHSRSMSQQASLTSRNPYLQGLSRSLARNAAGGPGNQPGGGMQGNLACFRACASAC